MEFLLKGLQWAIGSEHVSGDVRLRNGILDEIGSNLKAGKKERTVDFANHYLYPGLINAHDHLEMNLYPKMGHPPYGNYTEWGKDIYHPKESPILEIEKADIDDRLLWGGLKNLISGATTVIHHNPRRRILSDKKFPVKVPDSIAWSHSLAFGKNILKEFPKRVGTPFVIHAAEGVDALAFGEVQNLEKLGLLQKNTVLVHAIALSQNDIELVKKSGCSIVWCPASNLFLFNQTAPITKLKELVPIAIGSDSMLTGSATLLDEMHRAHKTGLVSPRDMVDMVSTVPARIFNLPDPTLAKDAVADLLIVPVMHKDYFENLLHINAQNIGAVFVDGAPGLCDEMFSEPLSLKFSLTVSGVQKKIRTDMTPLIKRITKKVGNKILSSSDLWNLIEVR